MAGARNNYGVVLRKDYTVDEKATAALRSKARKKRGKTKIFNFGGSVAELKQRCKAETGLPPPRQPEFPRWVELERPQAAKTARRRKSS